MIWTEDRIKELRQRDANGDTYGQIGLRMGISRSAVSGKLHRLKIEARLKARATAAVDVEFLWAFYDASKEALTLPIFTAISDVARFRSGGAP